MVDRAARDAKVKERGSIHDKYEILGKIGEGTYGKVYKGRSRKDGRSVAIKKFKSSKEARAQNVQASRAPVEEGIGSAACREIALLKELKHENIINLRDVMLVPEDNSLYLIFDYADHEVLEIIKSHNPKNAPPTKPPDEMIRSIMWQMLNGINYLHQNWIIHRDIKPSNILVMGQGPEIGTVKIADFGLARIFQSPLEPLSKNGTVVTIWYRAPELLLGAQHYTKAVDMWAVGCIFGEMMTSRPLFNGKEKGEKFESDQLQKIFALLGKPTPDTWPELRSLPLYKEIEGWFSNPGNFRTVFTQSKRFDPKACDLLEKMLRYNPKERITAADALDHPYFSDKPMPRMNIFGEQHNMYAGRHVTVEDRGDAAMFTARSAAGTDSGHGAADNANNADGAPAVTVRPPTAAAAAAGASSAATRTPALPSAAAGPARGRAGDGSQLPSQQTQPPAPHAAGGRFAPPPVPSLAQAGGLGSSDAQRKRPANAAPQPPPKTAKR